MSKWNPYALNKPCENCPFLKDEAKAIDLSPGRRDGIIADLISGETTGFSCHKTAYHPKTGGKWVDDPDSEEGERYEQSGREQQCAGALAVLEKINRPTQLMTVMERLGVYDRDKYANMADEVIDYEPTDTRRS